MELGMRSALLALAATLVVGSAYAEPAAGTWYYLQGTNKKGTAWRTKYVFIPASTTWKEGDTIPKIPAKSAKRSCRSDLQPADPPADANGIWHRSVFAEYSGWIYVPNATKYPGYMTPPAYPTEAPPEPTGELCKLEAPSKPAPK